MRHKIALNLGRIGRTWGYDLGWEQICDADIKAWESAEALFDNYSYFHEGMEIKLHADLSSITNWYKHFHLKGNYYANPAAYKNKESADIWENDWGGDFIVTVDFIGDAAENTKSRNPVYARHFVEKYIYDMFIIMNLSTPGSCEFLNLRFKDSDHYSKDRLYLSSYSFEEGYLDFLRGSSIAPIELPIEKTFVWYKNLNLGVKQKSDSDLESAIFALLYICKSEMSITSIVWMFHALEAVYKTRVGEGFTNLIRRMTFLLDFNAVQEKFLKKELRKLYDLRSSFVHGGYKMHHPMENEQLDSRVSDYRLKEYDACRVGFNLVALSLQKLIAMDWIGIEVREDIVGTPAA